METEIIIKVLIVSLCIQCIDAITLNEEHNENSGFTTESTAVATTMRSLRSSRAYRSGHDDVDDDHHHDTETDEMKDMKSMAKSDYWGGYYDFLINEGSYKFWAVFQLATAALLIYSGFAALYYAKVNPSVPDYDDYDFLRRRRRRRDTGSTLFPLDIGTFQRIMESIDKAQQERHKKGIIL